MQLNHKFQNLNSHNEQLLNLDLNFIISELKLNGMLSIELMKSVIKESSKIMKQLPNIIELFSPIMIAGDIHGQFYDLLQIFSQFGKIEETSYLFMGDYVDRGSFCIQVITLLLCMKIKFPSKINLLRGNHQSRILTSTFNFRQQCVRKYNQDIYQQLMELFDQLPLGAIVDRKYFCVHAGISPDLRTIEQIQKINRFKEPPQKGAICDLLWSDPVEEILDKFVLNRNRMCSYFYGITQSKYFLDSNKLKLIIRGHQVQSSGYKYQKNCRGKPLTLTIFSAPNYCDTYRNKGAILHVLPQKLHIYSFSEVQHPLILPSNMNIIEWSLPFLAQQVTKIFKHLLKFEKTKHKKIKSDKILNDDQAFKRQVSDLARIELIQRLISQKRLKNQQQVLRQNLRAICQYSREEFIQIKQTDIGQKYPCQQNHVIGPKLHQSFKKLTFLQQTFDMQNQEFIIHQQPKKSISKTNKIQRLPTMRIF